MTCLRIGAALGAMALLVSLTWANGGRPGPGAPGFQPQAAGKPIAENMGKTLSSTKAQYVTTFDPKATRAKLVIPQKFISNTAGKAPAKTSSTGSGNTLIAGMALSLCMVSGGFWWSKRGVSLGKGKTALLAVGIVGASTLIASALFADIATFPPKGKGAPGVGPGGNPFGMAKTDVDIEITEKGNTIYLVIPGGGFNLGGPGAPGGNFGGGFGGGVPGGNGGFGGGAGIGGGFGGGAGIGGGAGGGFGGVPKDAPLPKNNPFPQPKDAAPPKDAPPKKGGL